MSKLKKWILIFGLLTVFIPTQAQALIQFDAPRYKVPIQSLLSRGFIGNDFNPRKVMSHAQADQMLARASGQKPGSEDPQKPISTSKFLSKMFDVFGDTVSSEDFLDPAMAAQPIISYAKILNLVQTRNGQVSERLTFGRAAIILYKFLKIKDSIVKDSLYGKLSMHEHLQASANIEQLLQSMAVFGISKMFMMPTGSPPDNHFYKQHEARLLELQKKYPDKIMAWCTVDEADPGAAEDFENCLNQGGKGLKLIGGHPAFYDEPLNSNNMFKVYQVAERHSVPVIIHASLINIPEIQSQVENVYSSFPDVTFVQSHYCSVIMRAMDLERCASLLDRYPNLNVDMSFGGGIKRHLKFYKLDPEKIRAFIEKYQDRLMFGIDTIYSRTLQSDYLYKRMKCEFDLHSTRLYFCEFAKDPDVAQIGFELPRAILEKIYYKNPHKILGM